MDGLDTIRIGNRVLPSAPYSSVITGGLVIASDFLAVFVSGIAVYHAILRIFGPAGFGADGPDAISYFAASAIAGLVIIAIFGYSKLYDFDVLVRPIAQLRKIVPACCIAFLLLVVTAYTLPSLRHYSVKWAYGFFLLSLATIYAERWLVYDTIHGLAKRGLLARNVVIIGGGEHGARLIRSMRKNGRPWTRILGIFDDRRDRVPGRIEGYPVLGTTNDLVTFTREVRVDDIFIALPWSAEARVLSVLDTIRVIPANIHLNPDSLGQAFVDKTFVRLDGIPVLQLSNKPLDGWNYVLKAIEDKVIAGLALLLLLPVIIGAVIAIKLDSRGPIFFRQKRYGLNNKFIEVWKFRTMYYAQRDDNAERLTTRNDPRVTRVGRFLRRTSIDELPQLFNVLKGDMSVVGPRPHALRAKAAGKLYHEASAEYAMRHKIKPGLTGWAQVNGWRGETDTQEKLLRRVEFDLYYMENWSIRLDLYIVLRTAFIVLSGESAY